MSVHDDILDRVVVEIQGLALSGIINADVKKRALPTRQETLDAVPCCLVCLPVRGEETRRDSFEGTHEVKYRAQVVLVSAANEDRSVPEAVLDNRELIRDHFEDTVTLSGVSSIFDVDLELDPPLSRGALSSLYHYSPLNVVFFSHE